MQQAKAKAQLNREKRVISNLNSAHNVRTTLLREKALSTKEGIEIMKK